MVAIIALLLHGRMSFTSHPHDDLRATEPPTQPLARFWTGGTIILQQHWSIVKFTVGLINITISNSKYPKFNILFVCVK